MADPEAARRTQLRNIQAKTGRSMTEMHEALAATGLTKTGERRSWLMESFALGFGDANAVALSFGKPLPALGEAPAGAAAAAPATDPLDLLYVGAKAHLRPVHEAVMKAVSGFGACEVAPKKGYVSLRRSKQFAMVGPATKDSVEVGLNLKGLSPHPRLKLLPPGNMCQATLRIGSIGEVDAELQGWLRQAFDAAA